MPKTISALHFQSVQIFNNNSNHLIMQKIMFSSRFLSYINSSKPSIILQLVRVLIQFNNHKKPEMSKPKPRRVNYRINYCSSEDAEYPVSQLVLQSADCKGWQTKRFAPFPQTLIIELLQLTVVTNLSILSHQAKICTKIEIEGKEDHDQNWFRLGYTTLESGINTNYQSRQLRNISLGGKVLSLMKFTFHQNYANHINIFNQIGIMALLVYGQKVTVEREMVRDKQGSVVANLSDLDRQTILKLKNLEQCKRQAAENHQFDQAKDYKDQIQALQANIKALIILEKEKKQAIKRENYEEAKQIVERMKKLRGPMFFPPKSGNSLNNQKYFNMTPKKSVRSSIDNYNDDPESQNPSINHYKLPSRQSQPRNHIKSFDLNSSKKNNSMVIPFDEIKIRPKDRYPAEDQLSQNQNFLIKKKVFPPRYSKPNNKLSIEQEHQQQEELPNPSSLPSSKKLQKLTSQQFDECSKYFPVFNEITFEYLLSKEHSYRQKGIQMINESLNKTDNEDRKQAEQFVVAAIFVTKKLIGDKIISVLISIVDFFGMVMKKFRPNPIGSVSKNVQYIMQKLSDYLGHNNQRLRQTCQDVFASLPAHGMTNKQICYDILCDSTNGSIKEKLPKMTVGRLNILSRIIEKYSIGKSEKMIVNFCKRFLEDKNSDIRLAAVNLMAKISKEIGYENLYPDIEQLKPQVVKMIEQKIQEDGGVIEKIVVKQEPQKNRQPSPPKKQPQNPQYYCDYCKLFDKRFQDDNFRDKHLYSSCPMINLCKECSQAIEVSNLNNHLLSECQQHKYYKRCPKCKEAIPTRQFNNHTKMKDCLTAKPLSTANRCPLCHQDIEPGDSGWIKHLAQQKCPNNSRS